MVVDWRKKSVHTNRAKMKQLVVNYTLLQLGTSVQLCRVRFKILISLTVSVICLPYLLLKPTFR